MLPKTAKRSFLTANAIPIPSPTTQETVISHPQLPGMEVRLPAGAVLRDADGKIVTEVSLTPVPADQTPLPMPYGEIPIYYTLQPGGAVIQSVSGKPLGASVTYPNYSTQPPGATFELFDHDPNGRGWYVYGQAKVSADGQRIETDKGFLLHQFQASSAASSGGNPPPKAPDCDTPECNCPKGGTDGDPVSCHDGLFLENHTDIHLNDTLPLTLYRSYRNEDPNQRSFGVGGSHLYDMSLYLVGVAGYTAAQIDLVLANGSRIAFKPPASPGDYRTDTFTATTPGLFDGAQLKGTYYSKFTITLKDGAEYEFSWYNARLRAIRDRHGNRIGIARDGGNRAIEIATPNDRHVSLKYESPNCTACITQVTDNLGRQTRYEYDSTGELCDGDDGGLLQPEAAGVFP